MEQITSQFTDVFTDDGCMSGHYKMETNHKVEPVKLPKQRVPVAMMGPLKEELNNLQEQGIIAPVEQSTNG